jgi:hypothetical protein
MRGKRLLRSFTVMLCGVVCGAAHAGNDAVSASGLSLREAALTAARHRVDVEDPAPMASAGVVTDTGPISGPLGYALRLGDTLVTLDFCAGTHLLTTNNLDAATELFQHP